MPPQYYNLSQNDRRDEHKCLRRVRNVIVFFKPLVYGSEMMAECKGSFPSKRCSRDDIFDGLIIILCLSWYTSFKLS
jgi:hypothetical protein